MRRDLMNLQCQFERLADFSSLQPNRVRRYKRSPLSPVGRSFSHLAMPRAAPSAVPTPSLQVGAIELLCVGAHSPRDLNSGHQWFHVSTPFGWWWLGQHHNWLRISPFWFIQWSTPRSILAAITGYGTRQVPVCICWRIKRRNHCLSASRLEGLQRG
jgi:hypothetical protein